MFTKTIKVLNDIDAFSKSHFSKNDYYDEQGTYIKETKLCNFTFRKLMDEKDDRYVVVHTAKDRF